MERWTIEQLKDTSDLDFAISILRERKYRLNYYSPLCKKINKSIETLELLKAKKEYNKHHSK